MAQAETRRPASAAAAGAGARAYAQVAQAVMSPTQASLMVHEGLRRRMAAAKAAYEAGRLDQMCRHLDRCSRVLLALGGELRPGPGERERAVLRGFYLHMFQKLRTILRQPDVPAAFDQQIELMRRFCEKLRHCDRPTQ